MMYGPRPVKSDERMRLVRAIASRAAEVYGRGLVAVALYGSTAKGTDGPYSDIEMMCIIGQPDADFVHEWACDGWKAEVDFMGSDVAMAKASEVDGEWALTQGAFAHAKALHDPEHLLSRLRDAVFGQPEEAYARALAALAVGEIFEDIGKVRNAVHSGNSVALPELAVELARYGAMALGLDARKLYSTGTRMLGESLGLPGRPQGYDALCEMVMSGNLGDAAAISQACESFSRGIGAWLADRGIRHDGACALPF